MFQFTAQSKLFPLKSVQRIQNIFYSTRFILSELKTHLNHSCVMYISYFYASIINCDMICCNID